MYKYIACLDWCDNILVPIILVLIILFNKWLHENNAYCSLAQTY